MAATVRRPEGHQHRVPQTNPEGICQDLRSVNEPAHLLGRVFETVQKPPTSEATQKPKASDAAAQKPKAASAVRRAPPPDPFGVLGGAAGVDALTTFFRAVSVSPREEPAAGLTVGRLQARPGDT